MKVIMVILILISSGILQAQTYKAGKVTGTVKVLEDEKWIDVKGEMVLYPNSIILTEMNSSVKISGENVNFVLNESSALNIADLKKMTLDELLLALALEDIINAPRKKEKTNGKNTAVYGTKIESAAGMIISSDDFGIKRLNGAVQLAENGYKESAVITAKETYRKYPSAGEITSYRIYFADILVEYKLYEEAYKEFLSIKKLKLSDEVRVELDEKLDLLDKKLANN
jgi:hypothetical protein